MHKRHKNSSSAIKNPVTQMRSASTQTHSTCTESCTKITFCYMFSSVDPRVTELYIHKPILATFLV
jgi:hypothetical protein